MNIQTAGEIAYNFTYFKLFVAYYEAILKISPFYVPLVVFCVGAPWEYFRGGFSEEFQKHFSRLAIPSFFF